MRTRGLEPVAIQAPTEFLADLAFLSFAASAICVTLTVAVCLARSGLGTPPRLVVTCAGLFVTTAFSPFLTPKRFHSILSDMAFLGPLLMLAMAFSPLLLRYAPAPLGYLYAVSGATALVRAIPFLLPRPKRELVAVSGVSALMGVHLFSAWAFVFEPEALVLRIISPDPYFHSAIINMIRNRGIPSTGLDGVPRLRYHVGVHYLFAAIGRLTGSTSVMADVIGASLFLLPCLCLAVFVATLFLRPPSRRDARSIVVFTIALLLLVDGVKNDRYSYRSESELLGIVVLLLAIPLLVDLVQRPSRPGSLAILRLAILPVLVLVASFAKISAGLLLVVAAMYVVARLYGMSVAGWASLGLIGLAALLSYRLFTSPSVDETRFGVLGFVRYQDHVFAFFAYAFTVVFALAVALPCIQETRLRRNTGLVETPFDEVVIIVSLAALIPTMLVSSFGSWYFLHAALWFCLPAVVARLSGDDLSRLWRSLTSGRAAPLLVGLAVVTVGVPFARSFSYHDLSRQVESMLSVMRAEQATAASHPLPSSSRTLFYDSLRTHHVMFGPDFTSALRRSFGSRLVRSIDILAAHDLRSTAVFIPPTAQQFWAGGADCRSQSFFVPALVGIPMIQGLPPLAAHCRLERFYSFGDYPDPASHSSILNPADLCAHARAREITRVIVIGNPDRPAANEVLACP